MPKTSAKSNVESTLFKTDRGSAKYYILYFVLYAIVVMIVWPLIDWIIDSINNKSFEYTVGSHIIAPIIFAAIFTLIEIIWVSVIKKKK